jgi:hypothetical protein
MEQGVRGGAKPGAQPQSALTAAVRNSPVGKSTVSSSSLEADARAVSSTDPAASAPTDDQPGPVAPEPVRNPFFYICSVVPCSSLLAGICPGLVLSVHVTQPKQRPGAEPDRPIPSFK